MGFDEDGHPTGGSTLSGLRIWFMLRLTSTKGWMSITALVPPSTCH